MSGEPKLTLTSMRHRLMELDTEIRECAQREGLRYQQYLALRQRVLQQATDAMYGVYQRVTDEAKRVKKGEPA
jgi:hypothetical protein